MTAHFDHWDSMYLYDKLQNITLAYLMLNSMAAFRGLYTFCHGCFDYKNLVNLNIQILLSVYRIMVRFHHYLKMSRNISVHIAQMCIQAKKVLKVMLNICIQISQKNMSNQISDISALTVKKIIVVTNHSRTIQVSQTFSSNFHHQMAISLKVYQI